MKNFYEKINDLLENEDTDWEVLAEAVKIKFSLFDLYSEEEIKQRIEIENISPESLFSEESLKEAAKEFSIYDLYSFESIKEIIIDHLERNL